MSKQHHGYDEAFMLGLEWMWGEGYLSPGGPAEVAKIVDDVSLRGCHVLDIGCGTGGADIELVNTHLAERVTGIDVEALLLERGRKLVEQKGLSDRIDLQLVTPGVLPFDDDSFDVVFSKDSMIHIPDKQFIYTEIYRVLKPGGWVMVSDWLGVSSPPSDVMAKWLGLVGLDFILETIEHTSEVVTKCGFELRDAVDRNQWYTEEMLKELDSIGGKNFAALVRAIGQDAAKQRLSSSTAKFEVVKGGELRPSHIRARKPG